MEKKEDTKGQGTGSSDPLSPFSPIVVPDVGQGCRGFQSANLHFLTLFLVIKNMLLSLHEIFM